MKHISLKRKYIQRFHRKINTNYTVKFLLNQVAINVLAHKKLPKVSESEFEVIAKVLRPQFCLRNQPKDLFALQFVISLMIFIKGSEN